MELHDHEAVCAILADPAFTVPPVPRIDSPVGIAWLRSHVSRFSSGSEHRRRRALAVAALARVDPAELRLAACERASALLREGASLQFVPVETLAAALGLPAGLAGDVAIAAAAYQPHVEADQGAADGAVARLVQACGGRADESTAVQLSLLVQALAATDGLIEGARRLDDPSLPVEAVLARALQAHPPVPATRRVAAQAARAGTTEVEAGTLVILDLAAARDPELQFGAGLRPCPGREQALALAAGVLEAVRLSEGA